MSEFVVGKLEGNAMLLRFLCAVTLSLALVQFPASARAQSEQAAPFRAIEPQDFTAADLERYGLTADEAARGIALQEQGYRIVALTPDEAEAYQAGAITQTEWILIGIGVLIILAIA